MRRSAIPSGRILSGLLVIPLILWLTGCATSSTAGKVYVEVPPVKCQHPQVDPRSHAGLVEGLTRYYHAVELCNALNGVSGTPEATLNGHAGGLPEGAAEGVDEG